MKQCTHYSYCIFYLENKYFMDINKDLKDCGYHHIKAIIPTVRFIKKKSSRGVDVYQEEPILFNYGFMRMPTSLAYNRVFLNRLKRLIPGVRGWLRDSEPLHRKRGKKRRVENAEDFDDFSKVAMVPRKIVRDFIKLAKINSHLDYDDIVSLHPGNYIRLSCYPYIGADAIVEEVNTNDNKIRLHLYPNKYKDKMKVWLPLDMVAYNVYQDYNPRISISDQREYNMDRFPNNYMDGYLRKKKYKRRKIKEI